MDLNQPSYDNLLKIDEKLQFLQNQKVKLEQQYGFQIDDENELIEEPRNLKKQIVPEKLSTNPPQQKSNSGKKKQRYNNLTSTQVEKPTFQKKNAEISQKWVQMFSVKPDLMTFFDKEIYNPVHIDKTDFCTAIKFNNDFQNFNNYMDQFALNFV